MFPSKTECAAWWAALSAAVRASRQSAVLPGKLPGLQPAPPPHVSIPNPPYSQLTGWLRERLASGQLCPGQVAALRGGPPPRPRPARA